MAFYIDTYSVCCAIPTCTQLYDIHMIFDRMFVNNERCIIPYFFKCAQYTVFCDKAFCNSGPHNHAINLSTVLTA